MTTELQDSDYNFLLGTAGDTDVRMLWAPRIRTWDDVSTEFPQRGSHWSEPTACRCRYPHSQNKDCHRCMLEFFAKGRKTMGEERWEGDADGEYGAFYQSREVDGFRAHVVHYPTHGPRQMGTWFLVMTEFGFERKVTFQKEGKDITYTQRGLDIVGYQEVWGRDEGIYQAQELTEQWLSIQDNRTGGWSTVPNDERWSEDAAVVSPELLEVLAERPNSVVVA